MTVTPGDSLWLLAARRLGPRSNDAETAAYWPQLYAANRGTVGPDPGLLHPKERLVEPAPSRSVHPVANPDRRSR